MKNFVSPIILACLLTPTISIASMSGSQFMASDTSAKISETRSCIQRYVQYGYKKVPSEYKLSNTMEEVIRRDGLGSRGTDTICDITAKELGMER